jgi:hypothetical protein
MDTVGRDLPALRFPILNPSKRTGGVIPPCQYYNENQNSGKRRFYGVILDKIMPVLDRRNNLKIEPFPKAEILGKPQYTRLFSIIIPFGIIWKIKSYI